MAKSHSQKLRVLQAEGAKIVAADGVYEGVAVTFAPRFPPSEDGTGQTDRDPWVIHSATRTDPSTGEPVVLARFPGNRCRVAREGE